MKRHLLFYACLLAAVTATAASRTATEAYVTNRVTQATNALHSAIAPTIDYSTNNTTLVATIEATSPRQEIPEEISTLTNVLFQVSPPEYLHYGWHFAGTAEAAGYASYLYTGQSGQTIQNRMFDGVPRWAAYTYLDTLLGVFAYQSEITTATNAMIAYTDAAAKASTNYTDAATSGLLRTSGGTMTGDLGISSGINFFYGELDGPRIYPFTPGALAFGSRYSEYFNRYAILDLERLPENTVAEIAFLSEVATPETVTNIVRDISLGGIWDAELEVWWTPVMSNGALTYQATTNVNLNAEH